MKNTVKIFGVLNLTPDSFSDGGKFNDTERGLEQVQKLFADGADFVDVGGESTRPGARELESQEEWGRLEDFFAQIQNSNLKIQNFSLDTRKPEVAEKFLDLGGQIINDVSGFQDPRMIDLVAAHDGWAIVNHFPGSTIEAVHEQKISSINRIQDDLLTKKEGLLKAGVERDKIILDPGIGFGKTMELNWELLKFAALVPEEKVMIGHSKKRFLGENRKEALPNKKAAQIAMDSGAWCLRVHDPQWYI